MFQIICLRVRLSTVCSTFQKDLSPNTEKVLVLEGVNPGLTSKHYYLNQSFPSGFLVVQKANIEYQTTVLIQSGSTDQS